MKITAQTVLARWRLFALVGIVLLVVGFKAWTLTNNKGYMPDQPIAYSHALHAGTLGMDCLYCHTNAERSRHATVPPVSTCMGCHQTVRTDRPEIQKLAGYYDRDESVPWNRVWSLPDHVFFNHEAHVGAGVACQTCHGPIETMEKVYQYVDFSMGWCMSCHRNDEYIRTPEKQAKFSSLKADSAAFKSIRPEIWNEADLEKATKEADPVKQHELIVKALGYDSLARQTGPGAIDHIKAFQNAPLNCNTCHQ